MLLKMCIIWSTAVYSNILTPCYGNFLSLMVCVVFTLLMQYVLFMRRHMIKLVLGSDQYYYVTLSDENDSIRIAISPDEDGVVSIAGLSCRIDGI